MRNAAINRSTSETQIQLALALDGSGRCQASTGLPFLDHMLRHVAVHGLFDLELSARGDLEIDPHHTLEDVALALGAAFDRALEQRQGLVRIASAYVPMDDSLALVAVDLSGRPYTVFEAAWHTPYTGGIPNTLWAHFFESLAVTGRMNLHARVLYGRDDHHQVEALFKALGRALDGATQLDQRRGQAVPSTKGVL
ncbi:MAG: imidazoleglycerol-phosphate dehydratase HisB [Chloroflexota bacterium]